MTSAHLAEWMWRASVRHPDYDLTMFRWQELRNDKRILRMVFPPKADLSGSGPHRLSKRCKMDREFPCRLLWSKTVTLSNFKTVQSVRTCTHRKNPGNCSIRPRHVVCWSIPPCTVYAYLRKGASGIAEHLQQGSKPGTSMWMHVPSRPSKEIHSKPFLTRHTSALF